METLDLPVIDADALDKSAAPAPAPAHRTEVAEAAAQTIDLAKVDLLQLALAKFGDWRADVVVAKAKAETLVMDLSTQSGIVEAKSVRQRLVNEPIASARKTSTALKSKLSKTSKAIGEEEAHIVQAYSQVAALLTPQIEAAESKLEAEKEAKRAAEANRKAAHEAGIARIRSYLDLAKGLPSDRIQKGIDLLEAMTFTTETWEEYAVPAADAACQTIEALKRMRDETLAAETLKAENEKMRAELERLRAAQAPAPAPEVAQVEQNAPEGDQACSEHAGGVMEPEACVSATGRGTDGAPALATLPAASPSVGSMGAEQPADAGLAGAGYVIAASPLSGMILGEASQTVSVTTPLKDEVATLIELLRLQLDGKFPTQPKPGADWWADVRAQVEAIESLGVLA